MQSLGNVYKAAESAVQRTFTSFGFGGVQIQFLFRINGEIFQSKPLPQLIAELQPVLEKAEARPAAQSGPSRRKIPELVGLASNCERSRSHSDCTRAPPLRCTCFV